jgi:hypothetical protein
MSRRTALIAIIAAGTALRIGVAASLGNGIDPLPGVADQVSYHELALRVLGGHGFSFATGWWPVTRANEPTAHWSFLYVLYLAAVYLVTGPLPVAARLLQALIAGVAQPFFAWRVGRRLFGEDVGLASAALAAFYGYFVFYGGALVTESLYIAAFMWSIDVATTIAYAARAGELPRLRTWALLGMAFGVTALLRQAFILVLPIVVMWVAWEALKIGRPWTARVVPLAMRLGVAGLVMAACILPWTVRNQRAFGQFVLINSNAGYVFFYGAHPMHGTSFVPILDGGPAQYQALLPPETRKLRLNEAALDRYLLQRGIEFVKADPVRYARVSVSRAREFFKFWPSADSGRLSNVVRVLSFGVLLPLIAIGIAMVFPGRRGEYRRGASGALLLVSVAAVYSLAHLLTWTLVRYRLPVDALLMPVAGVAVVALVSRLRALAPGAAGRLAGPANGISAL